MRRHAIAQGALRTERDLKSLVERFICNPHQSGKNGGHDINARQSCTCWVRDGHMIQGDMAAGPPRATMLLTGTGGQVIALEPGRT